ncbi:benzoate-CoA ligase family protein [Pseudonocardia humida]|uniref:Benzoate-CoA ligase family protein n=1 Tax=Pseudonocardia humida TaxID=2800819 RepID=A0ABT0ZTF2_9PSEU|nr:benzoate-CoA ligase family protein [Pseudonocardia humida]MCO1653969.1 benzoate-CoA ligase family protein [Pseudonocardia humida]
MTEPFNAASYLTERRVSEGDGRRIALRHPRGSHTYEQLTAEVQRVAGGLRALGVRPEERVMLCMTDDVELATGILAAMYVGAVAVPTSTMLTGGELAKLVVDSRARVLLGSREFAASVTAAAADAPDLGHLVLTGDTAPDVPGVRTLTWDQLRDAAPVERAYDTWDESPALWLYTSGTTGTPKGAMHRHTDIRFVAETYGARVLGLRPDDVCLSAAKLFFAYGIGNSLFFPLAAGASAVLEPSRPNPKLYTDRIAEHGVTLFFGGPSFWGPLMAADFPREAFATVRNGISAGEALPARMYHGVLEQYGFEILDGIGSTEALHIFISNVAGKVVPGSSGFPVPGYRVELRRPDGSVIDGPGEPGMLFVAGESICTGYWCRTAVNRAVFQGEWMRTGDQYVLGEDGSYTCLGRADDVLKVGGIWVSPAEVETRLLEHPDVAEAVVVGVPDDDGLDKPVAYIVPRPGRHVDEADVIAFCRAGMAAFKRPRRVIEIDELPKTGTGKIQRFRLRALAAQVAPPPSLPTDVAEAQG